MPKEMDLIKTNSVIRYVKEIKKMRVSGTAANDLCARMNQILKDILTQATESAKTQNRNTIMPRDTEPVIEKILGSKDLNAQEIFEEIKKSTPIELGEISKMITTYIEGKKQG